MRSIDEFGFLGTVEESEDGLRVELVLPVTNWPHLDTLRARVHDLAPGAEIVVRTMSDDGRLALRNFLRGAMSARRPGIDPAVSRPSLQDAGVGHLLG